MYKATHTRAFESFHAHANACCWQWSANKKEKCADIPHLSRVRWAAERAPFVAAVNAVPTTTMLLCGWLLRCAHLYNPVMVLAAAWGQWVNQECPHTWHLHLGMCASVDLFGKHYTQIFTYPHASIASTTTLTHIWGIHFLKCQRQCCVSAICSCSCFTKNFINCVSCFMILGCAVNVNRLATSAITPPNISSFSCTFL